MKPSLTNHVFMSCTSTGILVCQSAKVVGDTSRLQSTLLYWWPAACRGLSSTCRTTILMPLAASSLTMPLKCAGVLVSTTITSTSTYRQHLCVGRCTTAWASSYNIPSAHTVNRTLRTTTPPAESHMSAALTTPLPQHPSSRSPDAAHADVPSGCCTACHSILVLLGSLLYLHVAALPAACFLHRSHQSLETVSDISVVKRSAGLT